MTKEVFKGGDQFSLHGIDWDGIVVSSLTPEFSYLRELDEYKSTALEKLVAVGFLSRARRFNQLNDKATQVRHTYVVLGVLKVNMMQESLWRILTLHCKYSSNRFRKRRALLVCLR